MMFSKKTDFFCFISHGRKFWDMTLLINRFRHLIVLQLFILLTVRMTGNEVNSHLYILVNDFVIRRGL